MSTEGDAPELLKDDFQITRISLNDSSPHPVTNEGGFAPNYQVGRLVLYDRAQANGIDLPCTVDLSSKTKQCLFVEFQWTSESYTNVEIRFEASYKNVKNILATNDNDWKVLSSVTTDGVYTSNCILQLTLPNFPTDTVPWGIQGATEWKIFARKSAEDANYKPLALGSYPLELYAISPSLPSYLYQCGLPKQLLEIFVLPTFEKGLKTTMEYIAHVTDTVFQAGFKYDRACGGSFYNFVGGTPPQLVSKFKLSHWLYNYRLLNPMDKGAVDSGPMLLVNCYDQAGIVELAATLGVADQTELQFNFLDPFGYITDTLLVGWGKCNSPFYNFDKEKQRDLWLKRDDNNRTLFGNHIFVSYKGQVFDATCKPHKGEEDITGYIQNAIDRDDRDVQLYGSGKKMERPGENNTKDLTSWKGINQLRGYIEKQLDGDVAKVMHTQGGIEDERTFDPVSFEKLKDQLGQINFPPESGFGSGVEIVTLKPEWDISGAHLRWTMAAKSKASSNTVDINIFVCPSVSYAAMRCKIYMATAEGALDKSLLPAQPGECFAHCTLKSPPGAAQGKALLVIGKLFLAITGLDNSEHLQLVSDKIQEFIKDPQHQVPVSDRKSDPTVSIPEVKYKLNDTFDVELKREGAFSYNVTYNTGNIFLLNVTEDKPNSTFTFHFIARHDGEEVVTIKICDASYSPLEEQVRKFVIS